MTKSSESLRFVAGHRAVGADVAEEPAQAVGHPSQGVPQADARLHRPHVLSAVLRNQRRHVLLGKKSDGSKVVALE